MAKRPYLRQMVNLVLNIERVGWSKIEGQRRHDQRLGGDLSHVDLSATKDNLVLHGTGDPKADIKSCLHRFKAKPRADNDKPFTRFVIQPGDGFDWSDSDAIKKWLLDTKQWLKDEFGDGFVYAVAHADERTPHVHAIAVPLYLSKTKHRQVWKVSHKQHPATKGQGSYERLRWRCSQALGFDYGEPGNRPRTKAQREADEEAELMKSIARFEATQIVANARNEADSIVGSAMKKAQSILDKVRAKVRELGPGIEVVLADMAKRSTSIEIDREVAAVSKLRDVKGKLTLREILRSGRASEQRVRERFR